MAVLSKIAMSEQHGEKNPYFEGLKAHDRNPFHPTQNPQGVIQMGLAENKLSPDLFVDRIKDNPDVSICTPEGVREFKRIANFQDYHGLPECTNALAKFMEKTRGNRVRFDPDRIVMVAGATAGNEILMLCLANPGDGVLVPSPFYAAFERDLRWRSGLQIVPVECKSSNDFKITREALESAYEKAGEEGINIRVLMITNPSNPLGTTLDMETLQSLVMFVNDKKIHLVCDEIYAATVFKAPDFISVSEVIQQVDCDHDLIHIVSSLSKDMGIPGFRVGMVYSYNDDVVNHCRKMSSFGLVSSQTQYFLARMLSDEKFVDNYLQENSRRIEKRCCHFTEGLKEMGISCLPSNAGLFFWMDMRGLLTEKTFEGEMKLWRIIIHEVKLNLSPGSSFFCTEPGWFRVCFANMEDDTVEVALQRIRELVKEKHCLSNLKLSYSSPHSPEVVATVVDGGGASSHSQSSWSCPPSTLPTWVVLQGLTNFFIKVCIYLFKK